MRVDVGDWAVIRPENGGADQDKVWLARSAGADRVEQWLWKPRQPTGDGSEAELSDVSEVVSSQIAARLGLPAAECVYAVRNGALGVLSKNVSPADCDLHIGQVYLESVRGYRRLSTTPDGAGRRRGMANRDRGYSLDAVAQVLADVTGPPGWQHLSGMQIFTGYLVLDALIANTDRHPGNWALLEPFVDGPTMIAPAFDHGRALGSGLTEARRRTKDPLVFCRNGNARTFTPPDQSLVSLARRAMGEHEGGFWVDRLAALPADVFDALLAGSTARMSQAASIFVRRVLEENRRRLCDDDADWH